VQVDQEQYLKLMGQGKSCWYMARERGHNERTIDLTRKKRNEHYQNYLRTEDINIPAVLPVLEDLSETYRMAIVSTALGVDFEIIHKEREIRKYMELILVREDYERSKPDPCPYLMALERLGITADEAIVVEDSSRGLKAALAAGLNCVIVHNEFTVGQDFSGALKVLGNISELPAFLGL